MEDPLPKKETNKKPPFRFAWLFYAIVIIIILSLNYFLTGKEAAPEITSQEFEHELLQPQLVSKLEVVNGEIVNIYLKEDGKNIQSLKPPGRAPGPGYFFRIASVEVFEKNLEAAESAFPSDQKIPVRYVKQENWWLNNLSWILPLIFLFFIWRMFTTRMNLPETGRSIFNFGRSSATLVEKKEKSDITFKDVAGYDEAKREVMEIVDFLGNPETFTRLGARIPKGVLLIGPPGTGKTLLAKAVAGEAKVPFFSLSGSEFIEMFVGVGASRVRDLFQRAKEKAPCIIFIDEIDTVGRIRERAASYQANDERESTLNQLLAEMDGFGPNTGIIVLAATNRADILDPALVRPGRFDRHIYLELPDRKEREDIFAVHMSVLKYDKTKVDKGFLASQTPGFSGADIANVCNEAALMAARQKKEEIGPDDFTNAIDKVIGGLEKRGTTMNPKEKKTIAWHEAGHAIVGWNLEHTDPLVKVSIIPRGKTLGGAWYLPEEKRIITRAELIDRLCVSLGGRAAEEVKFGDISSGALDDLEKVRKLAYNMVVNLGLNDKLGNISFYDSTGTDQRSFQRPYSEATAQLIDQEVHHLIEDAYARCKKILQENAGKLDRLAELLLEKEIVFSNEIENILGKRKTAAFIEPK